MPDLKSLLQEFAELIGVMKDGGVGWDWFSDPLNKSVTGIPANRAHLLGLMRAILQPPDGTNTDFGGGVQLQKYVWVPTSIGSDFNVGLSWDSDTANDLRVGLGVEGKFGSGQPSADAVLLARVLRLTGGGDLSHEFGKFEFDAALPVPAFLDSASLQGSVGATLPRPVSIALDVADKSNNSRHFPIVPGDASDLPWDAARLVVLVLRAWVTSKAGSDPIFKRVNDHLFGMFSDPALKFPVIGDMPGDEPDFQPWREKVLTLSPPEGALTFLWHLRALITGNEEKSLYNGSFYFPLVGSGGPSGNPLPDLPSGLTRRRPAGSGHGTASNSAAV